MHLVVRWEKILIEHLYSLKCLNKSKGPAVHSLRAQADKKEYSNSMRHVSGEYRKFGY